MYRRLESKPEKIEAKDTNSEAECICNCGTTEVIDGKKQPKANTTTNTIGTHIKING